MSRKNGGILSRIFSKRAKPVKSRVIYKYKNGKLYEVTIEDGKIVQEVEL